MSNPKVSVIILNWNGIEDTMECIESLKRITYPNFELIVVDNASSGNDVEVLKESYKDYVHVIANDRNYGFSEGNNIGMRHALNNRNDYVLLLNNDTVVDPEFLTELVRVAQQDNEVGLAAGKVYYYASPNKLQTVGGQINWWLGRLTNYGDQEDMGQFDQIAKRDFVYATAVLIKRKVMERISLLDASLFFGIEEYDYCTRAVQAGFKVVYVPYSKVWHKAGASRKKLPEHPETWALIRKEAGFLSYRHYYRIFSKHGPRYLFFIGFLNFTLYASAVHFFGLLRGMFYYLSRGDVKAIRRYLAGWSKR